MKNNHTFVILAYKESEYLENCIKSVLNQTLKTNAIIATSTPNNYIKKLAKKYNLEIIINENPNGIAGDFNFAVTCIDSDLITIAHQDDEYDNNYAKKVIDNYKKYKDSIIFFTDYYEIRKDEKVYNNKILKLKRLLLTPLRLKKISNLKFIKRSAIRFGNAICCPSVTFCKKNISTNEIFTSSFTSNMDWLAWERLSKLKGRFTYINEPLMGHRIHAESTTTKIIKDGNRTKEDYEMFIKFWPKCIAKIINNLYKKNEKSNDIK